MGKVHPRELAIYEQLKSQASDPGLEKSRRGTLATRGQMAGYRRSTAKILIEMLDETDEFEKKQKEIEKIQKKAERSSHRKRRRGHKVLSLYKYV